MKSDRITATQRRNVILATAKPSPQNRGQTLDIQFTLYDDGHVGMGSSNGSSDESLQLPSSHDAVAEVAKMFGRLERERIKRIATAHPPVGSRFLDRLLNRLT